LTALSWLLVPEESGREEKDSGLAIQGTTPDALLPIGQAA
jgi:hypothetical protein